MALAKCVHGGGGRGRGGERAATYSAPMEVLLHREDQCLVLWNTLDLVPPLARNLDGRLYGLGARVHGEQHVEAEELGGVFGEAGEDIVVEGAAAERQARGLLRQRLDELGV